MKKCLTLTLDTDQVLTIKQSENVVGKLEFLVDDSKVITLDQKESEIVTAFLDKALG